MQLPAPFSPALFFLAVLPLGVATAQMAPIQGHWEPVHVRSGIQANLSPVEGVVWTGLVTAPQAAPWVRLYFSNIHLEGGSYLRIASMLDGDVQTMHMEHVEQWQRSSAYFNGGSVMLQIVAAPGTRKNFVELDRVMAGDAIADVPPPETICGGTDDRTPSSNAAAGRILGVGCSGWIIAQPTTGNDRLHLSAGHCFGTGQVLQFNVPASSTSCGLVHPAATLQFAIDDAGSLTQNTGIGNDWWVYRCFVNSTSGLTTFQTQAAAFTLATSMPAAGTTLVNFGYGVDGTPTNGAPNAASCGCASPNGARNQVQQTHTGPLVSTVGTRVNHSVDTCGGNSGSVIANNTTGQAIVIHTNAGCTSTGGSNSGTAVTNAGLQSAITTMVAGPPTPPANDACAAAIVVPAGTTGPHTNVAATNGTAFTCIAQGQRDVWFQHTAACTGVYTISTCTPAPSFDTTLEVFSGTCAALTSLACNDDNATCGAGSLSSSLTVSLTVGQVVRIHVGGFNGATGTFHLTITPPCTIADECAVATPVVLGVNGPFTNIGATASAPAWPCGLGTQNDMWYRFTANCTAPTTFYTCTPTLLFDTVVQVFSGSCGALTSLGCNDDSTCGVGSVLTVNLTAGQTYFARVGGYNGQTVAFDLGIECGTFTGSMTTTATACGSAPTISVTGAPHIQGQLTVTLTGALGAPFVGYGFNLTPLPLCGCTFGHEWNTALFGNAVGITIPCDPIFVGVTFGLQGLDLGGAGGCPSPQFTVTDTVLVTIG